MKYAIYFFTSILFLLNPFHLTAQSLNETVDNINDLLKNYNYNSPKSIIPDPYYGHIEVDSNGLIQSFIFEKNSKEGKIVKIPSSHGYLKSLDIVIESSEDSGKYRVKLVCSNGNRCLFNGHGNIIPSDSSGMGFTVTNLEVQNKVGKAFEHLLVLAKNNSAFYSKEHLVK
jgi:hypothetical protein